MQNLNLIGIWKRQQRCCSVHVKWSPKMVDSVHFCLCFSACEGVQQHNVYASISLIHLFFLNRYRYAARKRCNVDLLHRPVWKFQKNALFALFTAHLVKSNDYYQTMGLIDHSIVWNSENDLTHIFIFIHCGNILISNRK